MLALTRQFIQARSDGMCLQDTGQTHWRFEPVNISFKPREPQL